MALVHEKGGTPAESNLQLVQNCFSGILHIVHNSSLSQVAVVHCPAAPAQQTTSMVMSANEGRHVKQQLIQSQKGLLEHQTIGGAEQPIIRSHMQTLHLCHA